MIAQTSLEALRTIPLGARQTEVLRLVAAHPGRTAMELARLAGWADPNRCRPRLTELYHSGRVESCGQRPCGVTGRMSLCWRLLGPPAQGELGL